MQNRENVPFITVIFYDYKHSRSWRFLIDSLFRAPLRVRLCTSQHLESHTMSQSSQLTDKDCKLLILQLSWKTLFKGSAYWWWGKWSHWSICQTSWKCLGPKWGVRKNTNLKVYTGAVLPALLHACETWTVYQRRSDRLNYFHTNCMSKLLKNRWQDKIPDTEVLKWAGIPSIHTSPKLVQLKWTCHDERLQKSYRKLQMEKRSKCGQKKRYTDTLKAFHKDFHKQLLSLEQTAQSCTRTDSDNYEAKRVCNAEQKHK